MFFEDLSPYKCTYSWPFNTGPLIAVGWLSGKVEFNQGPVPSDFVKMLLVLCKEPIHKTRGFHICPFCRNTDSSIGNGEIHVQGSEGIYVAPTMIGHYVVEHGYRPPKLFIEAVRTMNTNKSNATPSALVEKVVHLANNPTEENKWNFYKELLRNKVGFRVPQNLGSVPSGEYVTNAGSDLRIPTALSPSGETMLLVMANIPWLHEREPATVFGEMDGGEVLKIAKSVKAGVIVQVLGPDCSAWSGVPAADVVKILDEENVP